MSGRKIIEALEKATAGDFARVTVAGHVWVRDGVDKAAAWDAVAAAHTVERERCAKLAEDFACAIRNANINPATINAACLVLGQIAEHIRAAPASLPPDLSSPSLPAIGGGA